MKIYVGSQHGNAMGIAQELYAILKDLNEEMKISILPLNDLLNETAAGDTNTQSAMAPASLSEPFATGASLPMDTTGMPASVANAVTRDYSGLMKAIDKKKGL